MPEVLIVADDLTGAADCGIAFAAQGFATLVTLGEAGGVDDADVLAIDADTRAQSPAAAARETARLVGRFGPSSGALFKKIDSTLRGHVGAEVAAALTAWRSATGSGLVVMTPAFPALGRTVHGGRLFVRGVPLENTDFGPGSGRALPSDVPRLLADAGLRTTAIGLEVLRSEPGHLRTALAARAEGCDALACDAETDDDLRALVVSARALERPLVWAGSAGLARQLSEVMGSGRSHRRTPGAPVAEGPILFVVGSPSDVARAQVAALASEPTVVGVTVSTRTQTWPEPEARLAAALASGKDAVVAIEARGPVDTGDDRPLATALGRFLAPHARRAGALVLTGGETARAVLEAIGVSKLWLVGEVEPGVPLSVADGPVRSAVITKAGAFGDRETLIRCQAALRNPKQESGTSASA